MKLNSNRGRESDTAARFFSVVFNVFLRGGWRYDVKSRELCLQAGMLVAGGAVSIPHDCGLWFPDTHKDVSSVSKMLSVVEHFAALLQQHVEVASTSLTNAADRFPMHGPLLGCRFFLSSVYSSELKRSPERWAHVLREIYKLCFHAIDIVLVPLSTAAPEGGFNEFEGGVDADGGAPSQSIMVCAWQTMREDTAILGLLSEGKFSEGLGESAALTVADVVSIGEQFHRVLLQCRHRGAMEKVIVLGLAPEFSYG